MTASQYIAAAKLAYQFYQEVRKIMAEREKWHMTPQYSLEWAAKEIAKAEAPKAGEQK